MKMRFHNFYILKPSLVPISLAFIMLGIVLNFVFFLNGANGVCESEFCFRPDIFYYILFLVTVVNWLFLNMSESTSRFSPEVTNSILVGFALFILSEIMLFFSFFWAFFYFSTAPSMELGSIWPPLGLQDSVVSTMNIPLANTIILLSSGVTLTLAQYASRLENKVGYVWCLVGMLMTIVYALYFVALQWLEYSSSSVDLGTSIYGSVFYMLTGLHGSHVIVGTIGLSLCVCLLEVGYIGSDLKSTLYTCTIWYWHFVDIVWIFVFSFVYMWGNLSLYPNLAIFGEADFAESSMLGFQEPVTYSMRTITALHNYAMFYLIAIFVIVCILLHGALTALGRNIFTFKYRTFRGQYIWKKGFFHTRIFSPLNSKIEKRMWKRGFETNSIFALIVWLFYLVRYFLLQNLTFYETFWYFSRTVVGRSLFYLSRKIFYLWSCSLLVLSRLQVFLMASISYPYKLVLTDIYGFSMWKILLRRGMYYNSWWPLVAEDAIVRLQWEMRFFFSEDEVMDVFWYSVPDAVDRIEYTPWGVLYYAYFEKYYMCLLNIPRSVRWTVKIAWINRVNRCLHAVWYLFTPFSICKKQTRLLTDYYKSRSFKRFTHYASLEWIWSILPAVILGFLAVPSIIALYALDDANSFDDCLVVKVIGHQWYRTYEVSFVEDDLQYITFSIDSFMIAEEDLAIDGLRLLDVDYPLYLPVGVPIKLLITSNDVIHSFTVPSFGIKADAVPGRLNQVMFVIARSGDFWGQCSELCGVRHGFMPIHVIAYN